VTTDSGRDQQRDAAGGLRHLLTLEGLSREEILGLLELAETHVRPRGEPPAWQIGTRPCGERGAFKGPRQRKYLPSWLMA